MFIKSLNCPNATMRYKFNEAFRTPRTCSFFFFADLHFNEQITILKKQHPLTSVLYGVLSEKKKILKIIVVRYTLLEGLQFIVLKLKIMDTE